jgi:hypothetical protein
MKRLTPAQAGALHLLAPRHRDALLRLAEVGHVPKIHASGPLFCSQDLISVAAFRMLAALGLVDVFGGHVVLSDRGRTLIPHLAAPSPWRGGHLDGH